MKEKLHMIISIGENKKKQNPFGKVHCPFMIKKKKSQKLGIERNLLNVITDIF